MVEEKKAVAKKTSTLAEYLVEHRGVFEQILPAHVGVERFLRITLSAVFSNPKLAACDFRSMLFACKEAAQLGLEPNGVLGHAAIIPYMNRKKKPPRYEAQFQVMYKGVLELAHRSGMLQVISAKEVHEHDLFEYEYGFDQKLRHIPAEGDPGKVVKFYAYYILKSGGRDFVVLTKEQAAEHGKRYSKSYTDKDSPWQTSFDAMAKKTALLMLLKYAPLAIEIPQEMQREIRAVDASVMDADFIPANDEEAGTTEEVTDEQRPGLPAPDDSPAVQPEIF